MLGKTYLSRVYGQNWVNWTIPEPLRGKVDYLSMKDGSLSALGLNPILESDTNSICFDKSLDTLLILMEI